VGLFGGNIEDSSVRDKIKDTGNAKKKRIFSNEGEYSILTLFHKRT
jgi:hypothetical protein